MDISNSPPPLAVGEGVVIQNPDPNLDNRMKNNNKLIINDNNHINFNPKNDSQTDSQEINYKIKNKE